MTHYLEKLTEEQMDKFLEKDMDAQTTIADIQESFMNGEIDIKTASDGIIKVQKDLKDWLNNLP